MSRANIHAIPETTPISTILLSESTMAFGRTLVSDSEGNYKGPLMLSLKEGYVLKILIVLQSEINQLILADKFLINFSAALFLS